MLTIIHETSNGGVAICNPAWSDKREDETDEAFLERVKARAVPDGMGSAIIEDSALPDRSTRSRWRWSNGQIVVADPDLEALRSAALSAIDQWFETTSKVEPAVDRVRRLKLDEAQEVLARDADRIEIRETDYPLLLASRIGAEALAETARRVFQAFKAERADIAGKEAIRLDAKARVKAARTVEEIEAVYASIPKGAP